MIIFFYGKEATNDYYVNLTSFDLQGESTTGRYYIIHVIGHKLIVQYL